MGLRAGLTGLSRSVMIAGMQKTHALNPVLVPANSLLQSTLLVVAGSLLIAGAAQIQIPLPFSPVPITLQTLAVLLIGATLGAKRGALSVALYLAEGSLGLPFFAGGTAGIASLLGPRGGYLVGFVAAAGLVGWLIERGAGRTFARAVGAFALGQLVIYALGVSWLAQFLGLNQAILAGVVPFLVGDALKIAVAASTLPFAAKALGK